MNGKKSKIGTILSAVLMFAVMAATVYATTDSWNTPAIDPNVGGVPMCISFDGTSAATAEALTVTTPASFDPSFIVFAAYVTATEDPKITIWMRGMSDVEGIGVFGGTAPNDHFTLTSEANIDADAGTIVISAAAQTNSAKYSGYACR